MEAQVKTGEKKNVQWRFEGAIESEDSSFPSNIEARSHILTKSQRNCPCKSAMHMIQDPKKSQKEEKKGELKVSINSTIVVPHDIRSHSKQNQKQAW